MKLLIVLLSMVIVATGGLPAYAGGSSRAASYQGYTSGQVSPNNSPLVIDTRGGLIYNMTLNASSNNATLAIYDSPVYPFTSVTQEVLIYEVEVASSGDSRSVDMNAAPLQTYTGIVATVNNGSAYLNVEK